MALDLPGWRQGPSFPGRTAMRHRAASSIPFLAPDDARHRANADSVVARETGIRDPSSRVSLSHFNHLRLDQLRNSVPRAVSASVFCGHVAKVRGVVAKKQMTGPHASRVVARMADMRAPGYLAVMDFPRNTMGAPAKMAAVSIRENRPCPLPAARALEKSLPEFDDSILIFHRHDSAMALSRIKTQGL